MSVQKVTSNDLPTSPNAANANGVLNALAGPADMVELKAALAKIGGRVKHAGGALPGLFPEKNVREGDARLVTWLGYEIVPEERAGGGGGAFVVLNFDVHDHAKATLPVVFRAQMILNATLEKYFETEEIGSLEEKHPALLALGGKKKVLALAGDDGEFVIPTRDVEKTPMLIITFAGQMASKKAGFAGAKRWIIEEFTPAKA